MLLFFIVPDYKNVKKGYNNNPWFTEHIFNKGLIYCL